MAGVAIVVATDTHDDKQEYAEDGDHDHEDKCDRGNGTLNCINMRSIYLMRGCLPKLNAETDADMDEQQIVLSKSRIMRRMSTIVRKEKNARRVTDLITLQR